MFSFFQWHHQCGMANMEDLNWIGLDRISTVIDLYIKDLSVFVLVQRFIV